MFQKKKRKGFLLHLPYFSYYFKDQKALLNQLILTLILTLNKAKDGKYTYLLPIN